MKKIVLTLTILASSSLFASNGAALYKKCAGCHGVHGEKRALGKSDIIQGLSQRKIENELFEFRDEKVDSDEMIMKMQVKNFTNDQIKAVAKYISNL